MEKWRVRVRYLRAKAYAKDMHKEHAMANNLASLEREREREKDIDR